MPYPFLENNLEAIKEYLANLAKNTEYNVDVENLKVIQSKISNWMSSGAEQGKLFEDDDFRNKLINLLFPERVIALFGGVDEFLQLPSFSYNKRDSYYDVLPTFEIQDISNTDVAIGMGADNMPQISVKVYNIGTDEQYLLSWHARGGCDARFKFLGDARTYCSKGGTAYVSDVGFEDFKKLITGSGPLLDKGGIIVCLHNKQSEYVQQALASTTERETGFIDGAKQVMTSAFRSLYENSAHVVATAAACELAPQVASKVIDYISGDNNDDNPQRLRYTN